MREGSAALTVENAFDIERLCRYFSQQSPQPMIAVEGTTHRIRYVNEAFSLLAGTERKQLVGRCFSDAVPEGEANGCNALLDRVYGTGTPEVLLEQEHGTAPPVYWSYSVWPVLGPDDHPVGVIIQVTDATEIAVFRQQVTQINEQLLVSATRQHELTASAENANQLKDDFLSTLSHELRTPLTVIIGWAEILKDPRMKPDDVQRAVDVIRRNARVQVQMIDDLLDVSRITTGKLSLAFQPVDLAALAIATVDALQPAAQAREIDLQLQPDSPQGHISGDPERLQQAMSNLVSNAIKFTSPGGRVVVGVNLAVSNVEFTVSDTGKGIAAEFLPHVFDRFRQADASSTRKFGGLGLGLSIVRQIVELHGGAVRVHSPGENRGSTFTISLPFVPAHSVDNNQNGQPPVMRTDDLECPVGLEGLRVLVVDDEVDTREMLQFILESCGTFVKTASSAAAALEAVSEEVFDVLISDIGMPDEDGYSLIAKVHELGKQRGGKVPAAAALTAYASEEDRIRVLRSGFQMHVPKPISPGELVAMVAKLAGRAVAN